MRMSDDKQTPAGGASETIYRAMVTDDIAAARQLWATAEGVELAEGDEPEQLERFLARNPGVSQVALRQGVVVGAVLAGYDLRRGFLYHLAVDRTQRGGGIGRQLVTRALHELRRAGVPRVLILVAQDNAYGKKFWRSLGWEPLSEAGAFGFDL
jgi:N-acetylglutamate synthase